MHIKTKFLSWFNITFVFIIAFFTVGTYHSIVYSIEEGIRNRLTYLAKATAYIILHPSYGFPRSATTKDFQDSLEAFLGWGGEGEYIRIIGLDGKQISATSNVPSTGVELAIADLARLKARQPLFKSIGEDRMRRTGIMALVYPLIYDNRYTGYMEVGTSLIRLNKIKSSFKYNFMIIIPIAFILSNVAGIFLFNKGLGPLLTLHQELREVTAQELYRRLPVPQSGDELQELFETINQMIERLEKSFEQLTQFSGDASHELRTPLTILKGEIELALRNPRSPEYYRETLGSVKEEVDRMYRIVEDLLMIAKSDSGEIMIERKEVDLKAILHQLCEQFQRIGADKAVTVECVLSEPVTVIGDALKLRQVFTNIIDNAIKYNRPGGTVNIALRMLDVTAEVRVKDTGVGIRQEDLDRVFDRFFRSDKSRNREIGGSGLGLSICKWIIEAHGGFITMESELHTGSIFTITLPKA